MPKGKLIVMEGACDGIGKTTQFKLLKSRLEQEGKKITTHHFPSYNTYQGKPVEMYLKGEYGFPQELSPYFINSLYAMDRAITWEVELKKEYEKGEIILLDRYTTSSIIYQSSVYDNLEERKKFIDYICDFEYEKLGIPKPDQVLFLTAPYEDIRKLREKRKENEGIVNDIHERDQSFMKAIYENAIVVSNYLGWDKIDCSQDGEIDSIENIHEKVYEKVQKKSF